MVRTWLGAFLGFFIRLGLYWTQFYAIEHGWTDWCFRCGGTWTKAIVDPDFRQGHPYLTFWEIIGLPELILFTVLGAMFGYLTYRRLEGYREALELQEEIKRKKAAKD